MTEPAPEFSRIFNAARLSPNGAEERLEAKPAECAALAKRFDVIEIPSLKAHLTLQPGGQQTIKATGKIEAELIQRCVITLEPIATRLDIDIDVTFVPDGPHDENADSDDMGEEIEFFSGGKIDLGEMVAQHLGVNIDLYPRKPDAALPAPEFSGKAEKSRSLAGLATLARTPDNKKK